MEGKLLLVLTTGMSHSIQFAGAHVMTMLTFQWLCRGSRQHKMHISLPAMHAGATSGPLVGRRQAGKQHAAC